MERNARAAAYGVPGLERRAAMLGRCGIRLLPAALAGSGALGRRKRRGRRRRCAGGGGGDDSEKLPVPPGDHCYRVDRDALLLYLPTLFFRIECVLL